LIAQLDPRTLLAAADNRLYLDYVSGTGSAAQFFSHSPLDFAAALQARRQQAYPRRQVSLLLSEYNSRLGAHPKTLENIEALDDRSTFCVIAGQQAGFLGGPVYTAYKIITAIRLAESLQGELDARLVPVFWLATEDHDFNEINHAHYAKSDGEIGRAKFGWELEGHPVSDLTISPAVLQAYAEYMDNLVAGPYLTQIRAWSAPQPGENFGEWQARMWLKLFSDHGLVVVEPRILRPAGGEWLASALRHGDEIDDRLALVSQHLSQNGYAPALTPEQSGRLYTFDAAGYRVRVERPQEHLAQIQAHPERYSTDAALRPLFADAMLPVLASVLGPGETAYQAMLRPLYELFGLPQPVLFPRRSYTIVAQGEAQRLTEYGTSADAILTGQLDLDAAFRGLVPASEQQLFASALQQTEAALLPLRPYLSGIDPSLEKTWSQTLASTTRSLETLQERAIKARLSQLGFAKGELRALQNALLPRGRLQERVMPLPHFVNRFGPSFVDALFGAGDLQDFSHAILTLEDRHG